MSKVNIDIDKYDINDHDSIAKEITEFYKDSEPVRLARARDIEYCIRFYEGDQWIQWNRVGRVWESIRSPKKGPGIPKTTNNKIRSAVEVIVSYLCSLYRNISVPPNSSSEEDKSAGKCGNAILDYRWEEDEEDLAIATDATWTVVTGNVVRETYWDEEQGPILRRPITQVVETPVVQQMSVCQNDTCGLVAGPGTQVCPQCNATMAQVEQEAVDEMGSPVTQAQEKPMLDETGQPRYEEYRFGDLAWRTFSLINLLYPTDAKNHREVSFLGDYSLVDIEWVKSIYNKEEEGYTGRVDEVKEGEEFLSTIHKKEVGLKGITGTTSHFSYNTTDLEGKCVLIKCFFKPTSRLPYGLTFHTANGIPLYVKEYEYLNPESRNGWHPYSINYDQLSPVTLKCTSRTQVAIPLQKRLNAIDSIIVLSRQTTAMPALLIPSGTHIKNGYISGVPNKIIEWSPSATHQFKPEYLKGEQLPQQIGAERQMIAEEIKEVIGVTSAMLGMSPQGVRSAAEYNLMLEASANRLYDLKMAWKVYLEDCQSKKLNIIKRKYQQADPQDRIQIFSRFLAKHRDISITDLENFLNSNLNDNTNVRIEARSFAPKSVAYEEHKIMEALQYGLLNPADPHEKQMAFDKLGMEGFGEAHNDDVKKAEWENDLIRKGQMPPFEVFDDHQTHIKVLERLMKNPTFYTSTLPQVRQIAYMHYKLHNDAIIEQQQAMLDLVAKSEKEEQTKSSKPKK